MLRNSFNKSTPVNAGMTISKTTTSIFSRKGKDSFAFLESENATTFIPLLIRLAWMSFNKTPAHRLQRGCGKFNEKTGSFAFVDAKFKKISEQSGATVFALLRIDGPKVRVKNGAGNNIETPGQRLQTDHPSGKKRNYLLFPRGEPLFI